jgi:hypothetical protein
MIKHFFELPIDNKGNIIITDNENIKLFEGGKIDRNGKRCSMRKLQIVDSPEWNYYKKYYFGKYPVIFYNMGNIVYDSLSTFKFKIAESIQNLYKSYEFLLECKSDFSETDILLFKAIYDKTSMFLSGKIQINNFNLGELESFLYELYTLLYKKYKKKPIILIDVYDNIVNTLITESLKCKDLNLGEFTEEYNEILPFICFRNERAS